MDILWDVVGSEAIIDVWGMDAAGAIIEDATDAIGRIKYFNN